MTTFRPDLTWFREARFGMFIHWGIYAVPAGRWNGATVPGHSEWIRKCQCHSPRSMTPLPTRTGYASPCRRMPRTPGFQLLPWIQALT